MRWFGFIGCLWLGMAAIASAVPDARSVAVLYNSSIPESAELARFYAKARDIPEDHLVGLKMPNKQVISRQEYEEIIADPLRAEFDRRGWWIRRTDPQGILQPIRNRIQVLVSMRGVPLKIWEIPKPVAEGEKPIPHSPQQDRSSVDSELSMFGVETIKLPGALRNAYFQSDKPFAEAGMPFMVLTARIDAPTFDTCLRMIRDAVEVEETGLWGMAYVDIAQKIKQGDEWLEGVVKRNAELGIPTVVDRFRPTLPTNYPARDMALYYGWYNVHVSGPFLNPDFRFRKGAVAMHLHSGSASQLRDADKHWSGPLLERGAAVTIGNVFEPYLGMTHYFDQLHQRLTEGFSWVEACWASMPVVSWQGVVLGDPLYRPFLHLDGSGRVAAEDREYRAIRAASQQWADDPKERRSQLMQAAARMKSGVLAEAVGLEWLEAKQGQKAHACFLQAKELYETPADQLRQDLHNIAIERAAGRKDLAILGLRVAEQKYQKIPEVMAAKGWLDILDPPPPPPAKPVGTAGKKGS